MEEQEQKNTAKPTTDVFWGLLHVTLRQARRLVVAVIGGTIVLIGLIMFFTPGPAMVMIPLGLAILATEFVWARRLLHRIKAEAQNAVDYLRGANAPENTPDSPNKE